MPEPLVNKVDTLRGKAVSMEDFLKLTKIPIVIYYGNNIGTTPGGYYGQDCWRIRLQNEHPRNGIYFIYLTKSGSSFAF